MAEEFKTPTEAFQWDRIRELEAALRDIAENTAHHDAFALSIVAERSLEPKGKSHD